MAKFYRGKSSLFNAEAHKDGLYFATDVNELYLSVGDVVRTYGSANLIKDVTEDVENGSIVFTFQSEVSEGSYSKEIKLIDLLSVVSDTASGLMSSEDKVNLDTLFEAYSNDELGKVQGVAEGDKVLSMGEDKLISSILSLDYDSENKVIKLLGKNDSEGNPYVLGEVECSEFIKDGMLDNVEIITVEEGEEGAKVSKKYIEFTWNVNGEDGNPKTDRIAVEDLVISYSAGNGISISEAYEISIKLAESTESKKNFLELDENGLGMSSITTDATVLQKEITVAGLSGTLGTGQYSNGTVIPAGTSIYTILEKILCKETYPTGAKVSSNGGLTSKYDNPSFTLTDSGKTVEVGSSVTVSGVTGYDPTATPSSRTYTGFTNGYSLTYGEGATITSGNPPTVGFGDTVSLLAVDVENDIPEFTLTRTYSGFGLSGDDATTSSSSSVTSTDCSIAADSTLKVAQGTNSVTYTMSGPGHSGTQAGSPDYYIASNLKGTKSDKKVAAVDERTITNKTATDGTATLSVTGAYKYYVGSAQSIPATSDDIKALSTKTGLLDNTNGVNLENVATGAGLLIIAVQEGYQLSSIKDSLVGAPYENDFSKVTVSYELPSGSKVDYTVYYMQQANATTYKNITITKI